MIYAVKNIVTENNQIVYNDGVTKIYIQKEILAVQICKSFEANEEETKDELMKQFSFDEETANEYISKYWNEDLKKN